MFRLLTIIVGVGMLVFKAQALTLELDGPLTQGALIRGKADPGTRIWLDGTPVKVSRDGHFVLGFGRDAALNHVVKARSGEGSEISRALTLKKREYKIQRITGVAKKYVSPPPETLARIRDDNRRVREARAHFTDRLDFLGPFVSPAEGPISGVYGSQRFFNGEPRRPHYGLDIAAPVGAPVKAVAGGIVRLADPDLYFSGGTIIIDHGYGVNTSYLHLSEVLVKAGDEVRAGQLIGRVGKTGRVTGAHLDWRLNWFQERLDPALVVPVRDK
ncbi:MAG: M23 family metallopeptidase [Gammaproteobacteria bacterium]|nr:MAG: M23 family metallopeptidase [Gammaproteobacteria bacterium]